MVDYWLKFRRKIRFAYVKSWHYGPFDDKNRQWNRKFEISTFIKTFWDEFTGPKGYRFVWDKKLKLYKNISKKERHMWKPIPWKEYCRVWQEMNPEWCKIVDKYPHVGVRYGTDEERANLDAELSVLRKQGLPRWPEYRVLENIKFRRQLDPKTEEKLKNIDWSMSNKKVDMSSSQKRKVSNMSTLIYHKGRLYADTQRTTCVGDKIDKIIRTSKLYRIGGSIIGCVGATKAIEDFLLWLKNGRSYSKNFTKSKEFLAFELTDDSLTYWSLKKKKGLFCRLGYRFIIENERKTTECNWRIIGSGRQYAAAVMELTDNPIKAISIAAHFDPYTNSTVECISLEDARPKIVSYEADSISILNMSFGKLETVKHLHKKAIQQLDSKNPI